MLHKTQRFSLRNEPEFFSKARKVESHLFKVFLSKDTKQPPGKVVVVAKAIEPSAVARNRMKRQLRSLLTTANGTKQAIVVVVKRAALQASYVQKRLDLTSLLSKAGY